MSNTVIKTSIQKDSLKQLQNQSPDIVQFILFEEDMYRLDNILKAIHFLKEKTFPIYLCQPYMFKNEIVSLTSSFEEVKEFYVWSIEMLIDICKQESIFCLANTNFSISSSNEERYFIETVKLRYKIENHIRFDNRFILWEKSREGLFSNKNPYLEQELINPLQLNVYNR